MRRCPQTKASEPLRLARWLAWGLVLPSLPALPQTESLPPSLRACAALSDPDQRHACYDREIARMQSSKGVPAVAPPAPAGTATQVGAGGARQAAASAATQAHAGTATQAPAGMAAQAAQPRAKNDGRHHVSARIASVDRSQDELILRLDNGEVWEQMERVSGDIGLRAGDAVTIDKHLGSYWLSARHISAMRVRKKS